MRAYIIKHKGKTWWGNLILDYSHVFSDNSKIYTSTMYIKRKDAVKYLNTLEYNEFYEVVGLTIDKSKQDNRKTKS